METSYQLNILSLSKARENSPATSHVGEIVGCYFGSWRIILTEGTERAALLVDDLDKSKNQGRIAKQE